MQTTVIYDTKFGNTEKIAEAIARGASALGNVRLVDTAEAVEPLAERVDLVFVGGPTQRRSMSPALRAFVDRLTGSGLPGVATASFDTRYRGSTLIMGSAAAEAAKRLAKAGARLVARPESFYIGRGGSLERQALEAGEVERAEAWGRAVSGAVEGASLATAGR
jgi:flavodoxin